VWTQIATDLLPADVDAIGTDIGLDDLDGVLTSILAGGAKGRWVVDLQRT